MYGNDGIKVKVKFMNKPIGVVLCIVPMVFMVTSAIGCSKYSETETGAACSIEDLNNLYKTHTVKVKANTAYRGDRDLRPVSVYNKPIENKIYTPNCNSGVCFPRVILRATN